MPNWSNDAKNAALNATRSRLTTMVNALPNHLQQQYTVKVEELINSFSPKKENKPVNAPENKPGNEPKGEEKETDNSKIGKPEGLIARLWELLDELLKSQKKLSKQTDQHDENMLQFYASATRLLGELYKDASEQLSKDYKTASKATSDAYQEFNHAMKPDINSKYTTAAFKDISADAFIKLGLDNKNKFLEENKNTPFHEVCQKIEDAYKAQHTKDYATYSKKHQELGDVHLMIQGSLAKSMGFTKDNAPEAALPNNKAGSESKAKTPFDGMNGPPTKPTPQ